jgi:hypothetical protein
MGKQPTGLRLARMRQYRRNMRRVYPKAGEQAADRAAQIIAAQTRRSRRRVLVTLAALTVAAGAFLFLHFPGRHGAPRDAATGHRSGPHETPPGKSREP